MDRFEGLAYDGHDVVVTISGEGKLILTVTKIGERRNTEISFVMEPWAAHDLATAIWDAVEKPGRGGLSQDSE